MEPRDAQRTEPPRSSTGAAPGGDPRPLRGHRAALALSAGCALLLVIYAVLRVIQLLWFPEPNPAVVIGSVRAGYFWRLWTGGYLAGMGALGVYAAAATASGAARVARALPVGLCVAIAAILVQGLVIP
jgi:hypothetical protein